MESETANLDWACGHCDSYTRWEWSRVGCGGIGALTVVCACMCAKSLQSRPTLWPHGLAHQAPLSLGFSRQEYWSGLPCPPPGDLPDPGVEPRSPALQADSLSFEPPGKHDNNTLLILTSTQRTIYNKGQACYRNCSHIKEIRRKKRNRKSF